MGRRGGEGSVFEATSHPGYVVKLYHERPTPEKAAKIWHLIGLAESNPNLVSFAAWPTSIAWEGQEPKGFLMPLVKGKEIHQLFGPRERFVEFPTAHWDFLVHVARNCAAAFDSLHRLGIVIGDVNEGNLLVTQDGMVRLIDCDSYQVQANGYVWTCDVGIPLWTAPELQGQNFRGLPRIPNHDLFGLAVLIFKTLFMGRHPYAGIPLQPASDFMLEKAIANYMFAFSANSTSFGVRPPPHSLPITTFPQSYRDRFERAFMRGSEEGRPDAADWAQAMELLLRNLSKCGRDPSHKYPRNHPQCPWCIIADAGGPQFFISTTSAPGGGANISDLWATIVRVELASFQIKQIESLYYPVVNGAPLPAGITKMSVRFIGGIGLLVAGIILLISGSALLGFAAILFGCGLMSPGSRPLEFTRELSFRKTALDAAKTEQQQLFEEMNQISGLYQTHFEKRKKELRQSYERYLKLDSERAAELHKLEQKKRELQLINFLDNQLIRTAGITGIGPGRIATLQAYGKETALDITRQMSVPGIGETYLTRLLNWRRDCEARFQFNSALPIPAQELRQLDLKINTVRNNLTSDLRQGPQVLSNLGASARSRLVQLEIQIEANAGRIAQALADITALS